MTTSYACRICSSPDYDLVLDYGPVVLADAFLPSVEAVSKDLQYPLTLVLCQKCLHLQIKEVLEPALLFAEYVWETGIPASIRRYCQEFEPHFDIACLSNSEAGLVFPGPAFSANSARAVCSVSWVIL